MQSVRYLLTLLIICVAAGGFAAPLEVTIEPLAAQSVVTPAEAGQLEFTITNTSGDTVSFLRYHTPLGGFDNEVFTVTRDDEALDYLGRVALRLGPTPQDWITLENGESVDAWIDLGEVYDLRRGGVYTFTFSFPVGYLPGAETPDLREAAQPASTKQGAPARAPYQSALVRSDEVEVFVDGPADVEELAPPFLTKGYSGCSSSQRSSLSTARSYGSSLSARSYNQLAGTSGSSNSLYRTWFGSYASSRYSYVQGNYYDLYYAFQRTWQYTCTSCEAGVIAYVYPVYAYYVWICPGFFNYGSVERGSFLLHEASHWNAVAGTDDYGYGSSYCQSLARSYPSYAVQNADNYRYFSLGAW